MNSLWTLTGRYLRKQRRRTILTTLGITMAVALVAGLGLIITGVQQILIGDAIDNTGNWHYIVGSAPADAESTLNTPIEDLDMERHPITLSYDQATQLSQNVRFEKAGLAREYQFAQLDLATPDSDPNDASNYNYLQMREFDFVADEFRPYRAVSGRLPQNPGEIAVSMGLMDKLPGNPQLGDTITLQIGYFTGARTDVENYESPVEYTFTPKQTCTYTLVGYINVVSDSSMMNTYNAVTYGFQGGEDCYTTYVRMKPGSDFNQGMLDALKENGIDHTGTDILTADGIVSNYSLLRWSGQSANLEANAAFSGLFILLAAIILVTMGAVIRNSFAMSVSERITQFGILRSIGASPKQIRGLVLREGILVSLFSIPLGLLSGIAAMAIVFRVVASYEVSFFKNFKLVITPWPLILAAVLGLLAVLISAWSPAVKAGLVSPIEAVRGHATLHGERIKRSRRGKVLGKIFGTPGVMAARNIRRNPRRFRTTVFSIGLSVTLFISIGSFAQSASSSIASVVPNGADFTVQYYVPSSTEQDAETDPQVDADIQKNLNLLQDLQSTLHQTNGVSKAEVISSSEAATRSIQGHYSKEYQELMSEYGHYGSSSWDSDVEYMTLMFVDESGYNSLDLGGNAPSYQQLTDGGAILFDTYSVNNQGTSITSIRMSDLKVGDSINLLKTLYDESGELSFTDKGSVTVSAIRQEAPWVTGRSNTAFTLVLSKDSAIANQFSPYSYTLSVKCLDGQIEDTRTVLDSLETGRYLNVTDIISEQLESRNYVATINLFLYGFLTVIVLISVLNIINTVSTNLLLRRREIGMMRAVGMSKGQLIRMLLLECTLYGFSGALWGSIAGELLYLALLYTGQGLIGTTHFFPTSSILLSFLLSILIAILAGAEPMFRIIRTPIVDSIRAEE